MFISTERHPPFAYLFFCFRNSGRYTDAIGDMLRTKAFEMPQTSPIFDEISFDVSQVQPAKATDG